VETKEENLEIIISKFINFFCHRYLLSNDCCSIKKAMFRLAGSNSIGESLRKILITTQPIASR